jgi:acyl-CoA synthetase (AMP-forming)/AMP-acid ligase II
MNVVELVKQQAKMRPLEPAIIDFRHSRERVLTFADLDDRTASIAAGLEAKRVAAGDAALIFHPMAAELYVFLLALFHLGAVGIFLDPSAGREHIERCCEIYPPKVFFGTPHAHLLRLVSPTVRRISLFVGTSWQPRTVSLSSLRTEHRNDITPVSDQAPALVTFTSRSTGVPKAAVRTHHFLLAQHRAVAASLNLTAGTVDLTTLPIFVLANLASGVCSVLPRGDMRAPAAYDPGPVIGQIEKHQISSTAASPAFIERLADECIQTSHPLTSLKKVFLGGAPVFPGVLQRAQKAFPNATITTVYGSTEAEPIAGICFDSMSEDDFAGMRNGHGLLVGTPSPFLELRMIRELGNKPIGRISASAFAQIIVPDESPGEIVVSGEHVLSGYLHDGGGEDKFEVEGVRWHRTGDIGYLDSGSRLWLLGRCSTKIKDGRGTLYSLAVECAAQHDARIARAALVEVAGERVLVLQPRNGHKLDSAACKQQLGWASLDRLVTLGRIPVDKRHNAKVDYQELKLLLQRCA